MTGYGQASTELAGARLTVELRSVNHRFADLRLRLPGELSSLESILRKKILAQVRRGRVEAFVSITPAEGQAAAPRLDRALVAEVLAATRALHEEFGVEGTLDLPGLLAIPGMFKSATPAQTDLAAAQTALERAAADALRALEQERLREGAHLRGELLSLLEKISALVAAIRQVAESLPSTLHERLVERLRALAQQVEIDPARAAQEAAFLADRADVTEELVRLEGHLAQAAHVLEQPGGEPVGKRLDFLVQEIHRETNTINSKSANLEISRAALDLKAELEKVREQVQNLE